jgi:hypothetical protein
MKRLILVLLCTLLGLSVILMLGCDKDDDVTGNDKTTILTPEDSSMIVDILQGDMFETALKSLEVSWELLDFLPEFKISKMSNPAAALSTDDEVLTIIDAGYLGYSNGWHVFEFHARTTDQFTSDTVDIVGTDSVQIIVDGYPVPFPVFGMLVDGLRERAHANFWTNSDDTGAIHHRLEIDLDTSGDDTLITVSGTVDDYLHVNEGEDYGVCDIELDLDQVITNIVFNVNQESGCPESGQIVQTAAIDIYCVGEGENAGDTLDINGIWTVTATVNEGVDTVTITFSNGTVSWTVVEPCVVDGSAQVSSRWIK